MSKQLTPSELERLDTERNIWLATTRKGGRPHLVPIWFAWYESKLFLCMKPGSVKARNLQHQPLVSLSLEDGSNVVICEGSAEVNPTPYDPDLLAIFKAKYDWDIPTDEEYSHMVKVTPKKWLTWGPD